MTNSSGSATGGTPPTGRTTPPTELGGSAWATGGTAFAGVVMMVTGVFGIFEGIAAIAKDDVYAHVGTYVFEFNLTAWGWIHLVLGVLVLIVGAFILQGADWARATGVALVSLVVIAHFMWLPYQPVWSLIAIAIGIFVIWALCADRGRRTA